MPADTTRKDTVKYTEYKSLPLKPERKIAFATNEGTWMSVDVSPDGQSIAFDLMGDIYTILWPVVKLPSSQKDWPLIHTRAIAPMAKSCCSLPIGKRL